MISSTLDLIIIADSKKDFNARKGQAWDVCTKFQKIWNSKISKTAKLRFFKANVEPVFLYGSETCTVNKGFDGSYTVCSTQCAVHTPPGRSVIQKNEIYGRLHPISSVTKSTVC